MINEITYVPIDAILDLIYKNELLLDVTFEDVLLYTKDFYDIYNHPQLYIKKIATLDIEDYRAKLPCDLVSIILVRDCKSKVCLRLGTSTFGPDRGTNDTFYTLNSIIYTDFKNGTIEIAYRALPLDDNGNILIIDNGKFRKALELYITKERFNKLYQLDKIARDKVDRAEQLYCWIAGQLSNELKMPTLSLAESLTNANNLFIWRKHKFQNGFATLGSEEHIKIHR